MNNQSSRMSQFRWVMCAMLFFATTINYMDRQVLSLTWKDFIAPEFHWDDANYGTITAFFSLFYAICMLFAGKFVDWMGTKKGYLWSIGVWSAGACLHAACGWATMHIEGFESIEAMKAVQSGSAMALAIASTSVWLFLICRCVLALGEAGNFPAAIKVTAEYNPKKDRAFSTSIFNSGASIGALIAPACIPLLAEHYGWEMAFIIIGGLGFIWLFFWLWLYQKPEKNRFVNKAELDYIQQDDKEDAAAVEVKSSEKDEKPISLLKCFTYRQTWSFIVGKLFTDGVWWFFLFWAPAYFSDQFGYKSSSTMGILLIIVLYTIVTIVSIYGGYLPKRFVEKQGMQPYNGRMLAMLIFAFFPLLALFAQPLGTYSAWWPAVLIGLAGAGHQAWSANLFSTIGDMFPKKAIATITGIGGMAGGIGSFFIQKGAGELFKYASGSFSFGEQINQELTQKVIKDVFKLDQDLPFNMTPTEMMDLVVSKGGEIVNMPLEFCSFLGKPSGYFIMFCICAVAYLIAWCIMKVLVPKYKPITD